MRWIAAVHLPQLSHTQQTSSQRFSLADLIEDFHFLKSKSICIMMAVFTDATGGISKTVTSHPLGHFSS
jgi:hypothetical protein